MQALVTYFLTFKSYPMLISDTLIKPLNPDIYLNHLPPAEANQIEISRNLILAVLGVNNSIWFNGISLIDLSVYAGHRLGCIGLYLGRYSYCSAQQAPFCNILFHFHEVIQYMLYFIRHDLRLTISKTVSCCLCAYQRSWQRCVIGSKCLSCVSINVNLSDRPVDELQADVTTAGVMAMVSMVASSYLFLRRVQAIYIEEKLVRWTFFVLWVILSGTEILIPLKTKPIYIPGTKFFDIAGIPPYTSLSLFMLLFFDTSVVVAISYKILSTHHSVPTDEQIPWYSIAAGRTLPRLSRAIFRGGQQYYL